MTFRSWLPLLLPVLAFACSDKAPTSGAMDQSTTSAQCASNDVACQSDGLDAPLAEGARLPIDVHVTAKGVAAPTLTLDSARTDVLAVEDGVLVGRAAGFSSVLLLGPDGVVIDFVTLTVESPERIELHRLDVQGGSEPAPLPGKIQVAPGDDFEIAVKPYTKATRLLGELAADWSLDGDAATMLDAGKQSSRRIRVKQAGAAKLTVTAGKLTRSIDMEVLP